MKTKTVKLRAFKFENTQLIHAEVDIKHRLFKELENTSTSKDRCMILNEEDDAQEQDLISNYQMNDKRQSLFCTLMRIAPGNNVQHITNSLLGKKVFDLKALENEQLNTEAIYKQHFYFSINGDYLVTTLPGNTTPKGLKTYLAYFLKDETIDLIPVIKVVEGMPLHKIKKISFNGSGGFANSGIKNTQVATGNQLSQKVVGVAKDVLGIFLNDTDSLSDIDLNEILSAELLLKFKKPKKMTDEEYKKALGAMLKPIADAEQVTLYPEKGNKIVSGKDIQMVKEVSIGTTGTGLIIEQELAQEMAGFLNELITQNA